MRRDGQRWAEPAFMAEEGIIDSGDQEEESEEFIVQEGKARSAG